MTQINFWIDFETPDIPVGNTYGYASSSQHLSVNPIPGGLSEPHFWVGGGGQNCPPYLNFCLRAARDMKLCTG